jgi:AhpC/TSA family
MAPVLNDLGDPTNGVVVEEGRPAPDFTLTSHSGEAVTLSSFRGASVVLYFYPKDDSLGTFDSSAASGRRRSRLARWR